MGKMDNLVLFSMTVYEIILHSLKYVWTNMKTFECVRTRTNTREQIWITMTKDEHVNISMHKYEENFISTNEYQYKWIIMKKFECVRTSVHTYERLWVNMSKQENVCICTNTFAEEWVSMNGYEYAWIPMKKFECGLLYLVMRLKIKYLIENQKSKGK